MQVHRFTFNPFQENTYVLADAATGQCAILDPGCATRAEEQQLADLIARENLIPTALLLTHGHLDHVLGLDFAARTWHLTPHLHPLDLPTYRAAPLSATFFGVPPPHLPDATVPLAAGTPVRFGETLLEMLFTPGHTPGHVVFYHVPSLTLIGGDVLFAGSVGRTDLPGGDFPTLARSICEQLYSLPDAVTVHCGHGPATTIGQEKRTNPFVPASQGA